VDDISPQLYERIAALEAQVAFLFQHMGLAPPGSPPMGQQPGQQGMPQEIFDLVRSGNKIEAIKRHRQLYGSSLVEAKNIIDNLR
jgi:ribosomal protein L7/L12